MNDAWDLAENGPFRDGKVHVLRDMCATCVFRPGNLMSLKPGRLRGMVDESLGNDSAITCHSTLDTSERAICRGFFDRHAHNVFPLLLAVALDIIVEQES